MRLKLITTIGLLTLLVAINWSKPASARSTIEPLTWQGLDFTAGEGKNYQVTPNGLTIVNTAVTAYYISSVIHAPISFNAVVPQWFTDEPEGSSLDIQLRTKAADGAWSEWYDLHTQEDWHDPQDEGRYGDMIVVPAQDTTHQFVQFQVSYGRYQDTPAPTLHQLTLIFIDTSNGPTTEELIAQQQALNAASDSQTPTNNTPRPFVISRAAWCQEPECWYSDDIEYETVTHMLVHHTVTSSSGDSAATIRAIWEFHTFTRGWGDIGYNYLVDLNGVIFEGHLNYNYEEWDVIGTHSGDANIGGLGTALLGNFTSPEEGSGIMPTTAMMNAVADLFAWKADQRDIAPYDSSRMVTMSWGLPHIMGHRDVYGGLNTLCPGGNAHNYLPWLRDAVAARISYVSPYIHIDEMSSDFTKSNANWYEGPRGCGNNNHAYYTWSTTDPAQSTNWGEWQLPVPVDGRYRIDIHAPYCNTGQPETLGARYTIHHAYGADTVTVNQDANVGLWMTVGTFDLAASGGSRLFLSDLTFTDNGRGVWFDGVRLLYLGEAIAQANNLAPANENWVTDAPVPFSWQLISTAPVIQTQLQVATDPAITDLVVDQVWSGAVLQYDHTFSQDYQDLYWYVTAVIQHPDNSTETVTSDITRFHLDATPPTTAVSGIYQIPNRPGYTIAWDGTDALTGLTGYTIQYRAQGNPEWTTWLANTTVNTASFIPPDSQVYEFRSQGVDAVGNIEPPHPNADMNTNQAILLSHVIMFPVIRR